MSASGTITIPEGPWDVSDHPARAEAAARGFLLDPVDPDEINPATKRAWKAEFLVTDRGLPVHPMAKLGVTTEIWDDTAGELCKLGMATGIGREWRYGPLNIGNIGFGRRGPGGEIEYAVAATVRGEEMRYSFPGGYVEPGESIADACVREGNEEVGIVEACESAGIPWRSVEELPHVLWELSPWIAGSCTINAWLAEHFLMIDASDVLGMQGVTLRTGDTAEVKRVEWRSARTLIADRTFMGAHRRALRAHIHVMGAE
jgi:8-oxo-dGTP pyrophosphatase MutT (NUDIX family)